MSQLRPETGDFLPIFFKTLIQLYLLCLFLYFWLTVSKRVSKVIFLDIKFKSVGLWSSYSLKQGNNLYFFKILIPLYLLRSFLYSLTYCIKEVINDKMFWGLNLKVLAYEAATAWKRGIPCTYFQNTNPIIFVTFISLFFDLLYQRGYQR